MILWRVVKPGKPFQSEIFRQELRKEMLEVKKDIVDDFERTVKNWGEPKVKFTAKIESGASVGGVLLSVTTRDKRFKFLDQGTKVRRAVMSKDWQSKTSPNVILSTPGKGKVVFISKKISRPGIKARNFSKVIAKSYKPEFKKRIKNCLERAARRSGYLYGPH